MVVSHFFRVGLKKSSCFSLFRVGPEGVNVSHSFGWDWKAWLFLILSGGTGRVRMFHNRTGFGRNGVLYTLVGSGRKDQGV